MSHPRGNDFPHEGFVQAAIDRGFAACEPIDAGDADLACIDESGER